MGTKETKTKQIDNLNKEKKPIPKWQQRIFVFQAIYSDLICAHTVTNIFDQIYNLKEWGDFEKKIYSNYKEFKDKYLKEISVLLHETWTVDRLNVTLLALLLGAISEYYAVGTAYQVLIEQTVISAKKYGDDHDYKFLNALLDNYWQRKLSDQNKDKPSPTNNE